MIVNRKTRMLNKMWRGEDVDINALIHLQKIDGTKKDMDEKAESAHDLKEYVDGIVDKLTIANGAEEIDAKLSKLCCDSIMQRDKTK